MVLSPQGLNTAKHQTAWQSWHKSVIWESGFIGDAELSDPHWSFWAHHVSKACFLLRSWGGWVSWKAAVSTVRLLEGCGTAGARPLVMKPGGVALLSLPSSACSHFWVYPCNEQPSLLVIPSSTGCSMLQLFHLDPSGTICKGNFIPLYQMRSATSSRNRQCAGWSITPNTLRPIPAPHWLQEQLRDLPKHIGQTSGFGLESYSHWWAEPSCIGHSINSNSNPV